MKGREGGKERKKSTKERKGRESEGKKKER